MPLGTLTPPFWVLWNTFRRMRLFLAHRPQEEGRLADRLLESLHSARSMARDVLQKKSVEEVLKRPNKLDTCARGTPPSPLQALQHSKHGHDLDEKAWHHLHVKKHEADMIHNGSRLRRSELFGEADTSAHPAVEHTNGRRSHRQLCSVCRIFLRGQHGK